MNYIDRKLKNCIKNCIGIGEIPTLNWDLKYPYLADTTNEKSMNLKSLILSEPGKF